MAANDDAQILQVPLRAEGVKSEDWSKVRASDLTILNDVLREMQERHFKLSGRTGVAAVRSDLTVAGEVRAEGVVAGSSAILGNVPLTPTDVSLAPTVDPALAPQALVGTTTLDSNFDLLGAASPFTAGVKDEFLGTGSTAGAVGDLGWNLTAGVISSTGAVGHPGVDTLVSNAGPAVGRIQLRLVCPDDIGYLAGVVSPTSDLTNAAYAFGLSIGNVASGVDNFQGVYWCFSPAKGVNWATVTRDASGITTNSTTVPVVLDNWYLLEIVLSEGTVDFYINRTRAFRHTTNVPTGSANAMPVFLSQTTDANAKLLNIDTFVMCGRTPLSVKRWT